jgi:hypothetical protein
MSLIGEGIEIMKLVDKARNVDLYKQLGEWIDKVVDLQKANDDITTERNQLREQIRFKAVLQRIKGHTFVEGDDEEICSRCAEVDSRPVHLMPRVKQKAGWPMAACPQCKTPTSSSEPLLRSQALRLPENGGI